MSLKLQRLLSHHAQCEAEKLTHEVQKERDVLDGAFNVREESRLLFTLVL